MNKDKIVIGIRLKNFRIALIADVILLLSLFLPMTSSDFDGGSVVAIVKKLTEAGSGGRYLYLAGIINIFAILALIYIKYFNTYRIDYVDGELLVNPQKSIYVTFAVYAFVLGLLNGCFICRKYFPFNPKEAPVKNRVIRGLIGGVGIIAILKFIVEYIIMNGLSHTTACPAMFVTGIFITT